MTQANTEIFGHLPSGEAVHRITITGGGLTAQVLTYGAIIQDLRLEGHAAPLVLGFETLSDYLGNEKPYFGTTPGRTANRIAAGRFSIDGKDYQLECNQNGDTHLHGGATGLARQNWTLIEATADKVVLEVTDTDGRAGYPGNCTVTCTYAVQANGTLAVRYASVTDAPTPCNICQHSYFNLDGRPDALDHDIMIAADHYLPLDSNLVPTGEIRAVAGTPYDFRQMASLRRQTEEGGVLYDTNFCLSDQRTEKRSVCLLRSVNSGVSMEVLTTEPGIQLYTGSMIDVAAVGLEGRVYAPMAGLCLETQIWPDAVNHPNFPNGVLRPGETLVQETDYVFSKN